VHFFAGLFDQDEQARFEINGNRDVWVQIAIGSIRVNDKDLPQGDGIAITRTGELNFTNGNNAEVLIFDMTRLT
jgi:redox-sensitive bicupin YhaK (pirin superfamily)